jgi:hypothetical protein
MPINRVVKAGIYIAWLARIPATLTCCRELLIRLIGVDNLSLAVAGHAVKTLHVDRRMPAYGRFSTPWDSSCTIWARLPQDLTRVARLGCSAWTDWGEAFVAHCLRRLVPALEVTEQGPVRVAHAAARVPALADRVRALPPPLARRAALQGARPPALSRAGVVMLASVHAADLHDREGGGMLVAAEPA